MRQIALMVAALVASAAGPKAIQGDFNGDGKPDTAKLAKFQQETPGQVLVANPWKLSKAAPKVGSLGILVTFGGMEQMPIFVADADFFGSPMWQKPEGDMVRVQKRGKGYAIAVATESGADELLIWTGRGWKVVPGEDMP
jgi:hypothetical protein